VPLQKQIIGKIKTVVNFISAMTMFPKAPLQGMM